MRVNLEGFSWRNKASFTREIEVEVEVEKLKNGAFPLVKSLIPHFHSSPLFI